MMSSCKSDGVLSAYAVRDIPDGRFQGLKSGAGFRAESFVFDFTLRDFHFVEIGGL